MDGTHQTNDDPAAEPRWLDPEEMTAWLALWSTMTWLPTRLETQLRREAGLSAAEYHVLSQLSMAPQRARRLSELAAVANVTLSHLSRLADRLAREGWLDRRPDPVDGRYTVAALTDAGMAKVVETAPGHVETVRRYVFDHLTPEQVRRLGEVAGRIVEAVNPPVAPAG